MMEPLPTLAPPVNPETRLFWDATREGRLLLPRCDVCGAVFWYPRAVCPACASMTISWHESSRLGAVYSCTIIRRAEGDYARAVPYVLAYVVLDKGPLMLTNVIDCPPEEVFIGLRVQIVFSETPSGVALPRARPSPAESDGA